MRGPLADKVRLHHIIDAISEVEKYLEGVDFSEFLQNSEKRFATIKQVEIVGEACNALSDELKEANPSIPWKQIKGFRNISIHEYFELNMELVWETIFKDLPILKQNVQKILNHLES